jgi:hypothetical protein
MSPELASIAAAQVVQQTQQAQQAVVQDISDAYGGGSAPVVSSSVTAPGSLELFA